VNSSGSTVLLGACRALIGPRASHVTLVSCLVNIRTAGEVELRNSGRESVLSDNTKLSGCIPSVEFKWNCGFAERHFWNRTPSMRI